MKVPQRFEASTEQNDPSLRDLLLSIWRRLWIIVFVAVMFAGAAVGFTLMRTPVYESNILLLVGQQAGEAPASLGPQVQGLGQITVTMTETVATRRVASATIQELGLSMSPDEFLDYLAVEQIPATQLIEVSFADPDPERSQLIVNTVGEVFSRQVAEVSAGVNAITVTIWQGAAPPESPGLYLVPGLNTLLLPWVLALIVSGLLGLAVGLMVGVGLALVLEHLDDSWRSQEEAEQVSGVPTVGVVPPFKLPRGGR